ncbi:MAG: HAD-IB family phosphatase [Methylococcales bacterium]|nr:HAD-IB family phosphatase [Methylococcales bacterium]
MKTLKNFDIICFDCDSTLSRIEGIDECANAVGLGEEMAKLTNAAMNGEMALEAVYQKRLDLIRPNKAAITAVADLYISEMVDGVKEVFEALQTHQKQIHIISGGLRQAILPLAKVLKIPEENVHAVDVFFDTDGEYHNYNQDSPLARTGGKADICQKISLDTQKMILIGDGKTDLEAQQVGVKVIGFGGVARRELVEKQADFYISDHSLKSVLDYIL